jgi:hypothetical protein
MRKFPSEGLLQHGAMRDATLEVLLVATSEQGYCNIRTKKKNNIRTRLLQHQNKAIAM